jgi:hypothetical protein
MARAETRLAAIPTVLAVSFLAAPAAALTIDSFEDGDFTIASIHAQPHTFVEQTGLSGAAGGVRLVSALTDGAGPAGSGAGALVTTPLDGTVDDGALLASAGYGIKTDFQFIYDAVAGGVNDTTAGALKLDLSPYDAIRIDSTGVAEGVTAHLTVWTQTGVGFGFTLPFTIGTTLLPLDGLGLSLSKVQSIRVRLNDIDLTDLITVTNISAVAPAQVAQVPEPGSALLLAGGLLALALQRKG